MLLQLSTLKKRRLKGKRTERGKEETNVKKRTHQCKPLHRTCLTRISLCLGGDNRRSASLHCMSGQFYVNFLLLCFLSEFSSFRHQNIGIKTMYGGRIRLLKIDARTAQYFFDGHERKAWEFRYSQKVSVHVGNKIGISEFDRKPFLDQNGGCNSTPASLFPELFQSVQFPGRILAMLYYFMCS